MCCRYVGDRVPENTHRVITVSNGDICQPSPQKPPLGRGRPVCGAGSGAGGGRGLEDVCAARGGQDVWGRSTGNCSTVCTMGPLIGGPQCRISILRNDNVACPCRLFYPISHVEFKNRQCHMPL